MRALAQSLGREFGPKGVHVAHAVIDGVIDIPRTKEWKIEGVDGKISADAVSLGTFLGFVRRGEEQIKGSAGRRGGRVQWKGEMTAVFE